MDDVTRWNIGDRVCALLTNVWPLLEAGTVRPIIQAQQAHDLMETSTHIDKIMLEVKGG